MTPSFADIWISIRAISPELITFGMAVLIILLDAFFVKNKKDLGIFSLFGLILVGFAAAFLWDDRLTLFNGMFVLDNMALFFKLLSILIAFVITAISIDYFEKRSPYRGECFAIILFICTGMQFVASANELITLFISIELMSIPMYVLAAYLKDDSRSSESGLKYFIVGAFSTAILLYGMSLIYGSTGTTNFYEILLRSSSGTGFPHALLAGVLFLLVGFGFKIVAAPFHMWAPDVYEGAPTPITAFISAAPKVAGAVIISRFFLTAMSTMKADWVFIISVLSLMSMLVGNLVAIPQTNFKRMLAYTGIAHMGYLMVGLASASTIGLSSVLFYIVFYSITNIGAFTVAILNEKATGSNEIESFAGLAKRSPPLAMILALALLSGAGLPPLSGFIGKLYLFAAAYDQKLYVLVIFGIICSVISLYYYLGVLKYAYFVEPQTDTKIDVPGLYKLVLAIAVVVIVLLGIFPPFTNWVFSIAQGFMSGLGL